VSVGSQLARRRQKTGGDPTFACRFRGKFDWLLTTDDMTFVINDNMQRLLGYLDPNKQVHSERSIETSIVDSVRAVLLGTSLSTAEKRRRHTDEASVQLCQLLRVVGGRAARVRAADRVVARVHAQARRRRRPRRRRVPVVATRRDGARHARRGAARTISRVSAGDAAERSRVRVNACACFFPLMSLFCSGLYKFPMAW
jgi:hypothetical protein